MDMFLGALMVFSLRIVDVSLGTVKLLYVVRGQRAVSALLAFLESSVWLVAASLVFKELDNVWNMAGFALGFASGTAVGMTIERWIGAGHVLIRVVTKDRAAELLSVLHARRFGLTTMHGEGSLGQVKVLMVVTLRRRTTEALRLIRETDPEAFITIDPVSHAGGGYLLPAMPSSLRK